MTSNPRLPVCAKDARSGGTLHDCEELQGCVLELTRKSFASVSEDGGRWRLIGERKKGEESANHLTQFLIRGQCPMTTVSKDWLFFWVSRRNAANLLVRDCLVYLIICARTPANQAPHQARFGRPLLIRICNADDQNWTCTAMPLNYPPASDTW